MFQVGVFPAFGGREFEGFMAVAERMRNDMTSSTHWMPVFYREGTRLSKDLLFGSLSHSMSSLLIPRYSLMPQV